MKKHLIAGIDGETTGLEFGDHRFVEVYVGLWLPDGRKIWEQNWRINPERSISAEAQRVHGISAADVAAAPTWDAVGPSVHKAMSKADGFVLHNAGFDLPFLEYEFKRLGLPMPTRTTIDTMVDGVWATPDGKKPTLQELCFACGLPYDPTKAHAADYDVGVMMDCYFKASKWGKFNVFTFDEEALAA